MGGKKISRQQMALDWLQIFQYLCSTGSTLRPPLLRRDQLLQWNRAYLTSESAKGTYRCVMKKLEGSSEVKIISLESNSIEKTP